MRWLAVACLLASCATGIPDPPLPPDAGVVKAQTADAQPAAPQCVPGASAACTCSTGRTGAQVCGQAGTFGPCTCAVTTGSTTSTGTSIPDAGTLTDLRPTSSDLQAVTPDAQADGLVAPLSICQGRMRIACENPAQMGGWNDAGVMLPPTDASPSPMMPALWYCLYGLRCPACWNVGTGAYSTPAAIICDPTTGGVPACAPCN